MKNYLLITTLILTLLVINNYGQDMQTNKFKVDCFTESEILEDNDDFVCDKSRMKINQTFYFCKSALHLKKNIKRIGFVGEDLLILAGRKTFLVDENTAEVKPIRKIPPISTQLVDEYGNIYYGGYISVYVKRKRDNELIEIYTSDVPEGHSDITIDEINKNLLILFHYKDNTSQDARSSLFIVPINLIEAASEKVNAERIVQLKDVSSIAYNPSNKFLYMAMNTPNANGKLIKVKGQASDPCAVHEIFKEDVVKVISDFKSKIFDVFNKSATHIQSRASSENKNAQIQSLTLANEELERKLNSTNVQLESLKRRFFRRPNSSPREKIDSSINIDSIKFDDFDYDYIFNGTIDGNETLHDPQTDALIISPKKVAIVQKGSTDLNNL